MLLMDSRATPSCDFEAEPFDENSWVDLLSLIEEGEVVPVVGPELMEIDAGQRPGTVPHLGGAGACRKLQAVQGC